MQQPRVLEPKFQKKPKRRYGERNGFGTGGGGVGRLGAVVGILDSVEDVVVVEEVPSILALEKPGYCYGQLFPLPFSRRVKGEICISDAPVPTASEVRAEHAAQLAADKAKREAELLDQAATSSTEVQRQPLPDEPPKQMKLSLVEALYLSYDLERLTILIDSGRKEAFEIEDFFNYCCGTLGGVEFASRYVAYRRYRSLGWVVRDGESYGVTFVLYKSHPANYHSTYGVLVVTSPPKPFSWRKMGGLCRELSTVSKGLIICNVIFDCINASELTFSALDRFQVTEMHVKSWFARHQSQQRSNSEATNSKNVGKR